MGIFDTLNPFEGTGPVDPAGVLSSTGLAGGEFGSGGQIIGDPLDLFGIRAKETAGTVSDLNELAVQEAIAAQQGQIGRVTDLFSPFVEAGAQPLSQLVQGITGQGDFEFQPSPGFTGAVEQGSRALRRSAAARGQLDSSGTEARLADLVNSLTGQEIQGQIERRLQPVRTAQDASRIIGNQEAASAGVGSSVFSNLANQNLQNAANFGQARSSAFQSAAGGLSGLANLLATQQGGSTANTNPFVTEENPLGLTAGQGL